MTYKESIKKQCRYCMNVKNLPNGFVCRAECNLNDLSLTPLKRIRKHCLECLGSSPEVKKCDGIILKPKKHICSLHKFREGHNPKMRGKERSEKQIQNARELGERAVLKRRMDKLGKR